MAQKEAIQTVIARRLHEFKGEFAEKVAALKRPVLGNVPVSKDERRRRWWQEDEKWPRDPEESRALELRLLGYDPDGRPLLDAGGGAVAGMSREDVGLVRYPYREIDARAAAGADDDRGAARYAREMSELGPPEPEPLEMAELDARSSDLASGG